MHRVVEHLELLKIDLKDTVASKTIENSTLSKIIEECKDDFEVKFLESCISDNEDIISESRMTLFDIDEAISLLQPCEVEKRP